MRRPNDDLRRAREAVALSQADLADRLGVTRALVSAWECGVSCPSPATADRLVAVLVVERVEDLGYSRTDKIERMP